MEKQVQFKKWIDEADVILLGAGSGLSSAAGLTYTGERFTKHFADFGAKYGVEDMYSLGWAPYSSKEEHWAQISRHHLINRYGTDGVEKYKELYQWIKDKEHFVLTTNVDMLFQRGGFDPEKIFYTQGEYGVFQCPNACHDGLYELKEELEEMHAHEKDMKVPTDLIPRCPRCGEILQAHLRVDSLFIENEEWHAMSDRYSEFIQNAYNKKILFIEVGVGYNTPGIIKYSFERLVQSMPEAKLVRINKDYPEVSDHNKEKTLTFTEDIFELIQNI